MKRACFLIISILLFVLLCSCSVDNKNFERSSTQAANPDYSTKIKEESSDDHSESESETMESEIAEEVKSEIHSDVKDIRADESKESKPYSPQLDASGFVLVSDVVPDVIQEIRYYSTYNFVGERISGYADPVAILTKEAAAALKEVSDELRPMGLRIKIFDAYRPRSAVNHFVAWSENEDDIIMKDVFYPDVEKSVLFDTGYLSYYSGHSRGSTVDVTVFDDIACSDLDMGGTFDFFGDRSHADYEGLTEKQRENRKLLSDVMTKHGFKGLSTEWWHFTLIDEPYKSTYFNFPVSKSYVSDYEKQN